MKKSDIEKFAIAAGNQELVNRFGSAGAEYLKGLRGIDYELGIKFDRSLFDIQNYKLNPEYIEKNIKQQAGFSAEIAHVSKKNADAIINKTGSHFQRSEDVAGFGKNNNVVDIVETTKSGDVLTSQMKFVTKPEDLLDKIAKGSGGGKNDLSRYLDVDRLDLPTEQVAQAKRYCAEQVEKLEKQIQVMHEKGNTELANKYREQAENYKKLQNKISDAELSTEEAIRYRLDPVKETVKDIGLVSHKAGMQGAKFGAAIGGGISLISNIIAVKSGNKEFSDAMFDTAKDTLKSAGVGYATAFAGTAVKSVMQQSSSATIRNLAKTGLPAMIVSTCLSVGASIRRYAMGELDEVELLREFGSTTTATISTSAFSMLGQAAIPVPVIGGLIGGMIGYTLTNLFYHNLLASLDEVQISRERYQFIAMNCLAARVATLKYKNYLDDLFATKLPQLSAESNQLFHVLEGNESADNFAQAVNHFAEFLGKDLAFKNIAEFDEFMQSDQSLIL